MGSDREGAVTFRKGDNVSKVQVGTKKLIIDKSVKNVPEGDRDKKESSFPGRETVEEIFIEEGVESIGDYSFSRCDKLKSIIFPSTIKEIGEYAFSGCANLEEVDLSNTKITHINTATFYKCIKLKSIIFPSSLIEIGEHAFQECANLEEVDLSNTKITHINKSTFNSCKNLNSIIFPSSLTEIGEHAFSRCANLEAVDLSNTKITHINKSTFYKCIKLKSIIFPSSLTEIGEHAFLDCANLEAVDLSDTKVTQIKTATFGSCENLKSIIFPSSLTEIGEHAFQECANLEEVDLSNTKVTHIKTVTFASCKNLKSIIFPSSLIDIGGERAFYECATLEEVDLSKTKITHIKTSTFYLCKNLKSIIWPSSLIEIGKCAFYYCENLTTLIIPESVNWIEEYAFADCKNLIGVNISESTKVHKEAFRDCNALPLFMYKKYIKESTATTEDQASNMSDRITITEDVEVLLYKNNDTIRVVEVKEGVETIGLCAFEGCTSLESIQLPQSLQEIDDNVFCGCTSLQEINIPENVTVIQWGLFRNCTSLKHVTLLSLTTKIKDWAFCNCTSLENIELPQTLEVVENRAFANCKSLKKIVIPKSVKELGNSGNISGGVFNGCTSLEEVTFDKDSEIEVIENKTFQQCSSLKEMKLPSKVTKIEPYAFSGCSSLKSIIIHDNITTIGKGAFDGCTSLESIRIPSSVTEICEEAFKNCTSLTSLTIPRSVNKIEKDAFRGCTSLREVAIQNPDIEIGKGVFAECDALENIRGLPSSEENIKSYLDRKVFEGCLSLENPIGNEIHLAAEGKCWKGDEFPQHGHLWIQQALEKKNQEREKALEKANPKTSDSESDSNEVEPQDASPSSPSQVNLYDDAPFLKDYNGNTAFECAVRGGAPESYLKVLATGFDENGKTQFDIFVEENARKQPEDFTADELSFLIELYSKLITATPLGTGNYYLESVQALLDSTIIDPRTVPAFIENLNKEFETRVFTFIIMLDIFFPVMRIVAFSRISDVYFDEEKESHANAGWFLFVYISIVYLFLRELYQFRQGIMSYITDYWNLFDVSMIPLTLISTTMMCFEELKETTWMKDFIIATTFFIWMFAIHKTKMLSVQFAIFVSGVINIIWKLVPFFFVTFIVLGTFAQMYFINNRDGDFSSFTQAFLRTYSSLLAFDGLPFLDDIAVFFESANASVVFDEEDSTDWTELKISFFFGFFVVILLLNVLIAVVSTAWESATERGRDDFLLYRIRLFLEVQNILKKNSEKDGDDSNSKRDNGSGWSLSPEVNYNKMWGTDTKFSDVLRRIEMNTEGLKLFGRIILNIIYTILGIIFGLTWPTRDNGSGWSLSPEVNYNKMWGNDTKFSDVLRRIEMNTEGLKLFGRIVLNIIYTVLGIFFGLTWPTAVRKALFCIDNSEAITDKKNRLQTRLRETEEEVERLDKIDKHVTENPKDLYAYLIDCVGIPSHFELKKKIGALEKQIKKQKKDVDNFKIWEESLKGVRKEKED